MSSSPREPTTSPTQKEMSILKKFEMELHNPDHFFEPWLAKAEAATKVKRLYLASGILFILALYLIVGYAAELICNLFGFVYPAYRSLKALETSSKEDDTKWLIYWVTFATFNVVEFFSDVLWHWFPPYYLAKFVFLIWLILPIEMNGTYVVYNKFIRPVFLRNQLKIDQVIGSLASGVAGAVETTYKGAKKLTSKQS